MTISDQARRYLEKVDPAVSGQAGHDQTFHAASLLTNGFGLSEGEAWPILVDFNLRCAPPWDEKSLRRQLQQAANHKHPKPNGHLVKNGHRVTMGGGLPPPAFTPPPKKILPSRTYHLKDSPLPTPIVDGTREHIKAAFSEGEFIRLTRGVFNDEGREIPNPKEARATFNREYWLDRLDKSNGNPNAFLSTSARNGIYVAVNPFKEEGKDDADVTAFRHVLIEWDKKLTRAQQYDLIVKSELPCTAVIDSGGKSVHAWVRVDAKDRQEYTEAVQFIYGHFEASGYPLDTANRNPSRYSRLAGCVRFDERQELLALNIGAESFKAWRRKLEAEDIPRCHSIKELLRKDTKNDPSCIIGFRDRETIRYLCKGKAAWIIGPSGIGKSTLNMEFAVGWALGRPVFGITPARPLRSLIVQAENDEYDLAEMLQGWAAAHQLDVDFDPDGILDIVEQNVRPQTEKAIGLKFLDRLHRLIEREQPDIVWVDPLLSYAGLDVNRQDQVMQFLGEGIEPILEETGAVMIGVHHTGKFKATKKEIETWTPMDFAYAGLGSSTLVNWARAVMTLVPIDEAANAYRLELAKRGSRAGAKHPDGSNAYSTLYLRQTRKGGIKWEQVDPPEETGLRDNAKGGRPSNVETVATSNLHEITSKIPAEGESARSLAKRLESFSRKNGCSVSQSTVRSKLLDRLIENGKLAFNEASGNYQKGPNA